MIRKSHVIIASILLAATIVLSGCITFPPNPNPPPKPPYVTIGAAADWYYRNKPTPVAITGTVTNPFETGLVDITVHLSVYNPAIQDWDDLGQIHSETHSIAGAGSYDFGFQWTYTRAAVASTYSLECTAVHQGYTAYTGYAGDYFVIWQSTGAPTGQQKAAFQAMHNADAMITKTETFITAYGAAIDNNLISGYEMVDLSSLGLGTMKADDAIAQAQSKLDDAQSKLDTAWIAWGGTLGYAGKDYATAFALAKQSKDDALMAKNIAALTLEQLALGKGMLLHLA